MILRGLEVLYAIPTLLMALIIIAFTGPGTTPAIIAVGLSYRASYTVDPYASAHVSELGNVRRCHGASGTHLVESTQPFDTQYADDPFGLDDAWHGQAVIWASALSFWA